MKPVKELSELITVGIKPKDIFYFIFELVDGPSNVDYTYTHKGKYYARRAWHLNFDDSCEATLEFAEKHWPNAKGFLILEERQYYARNICVVS
jgi:hypothetical protein